MDTRVYWESIMELIALSGLTEKEFAEALSVFSPEEHLEIRECLQKLRDESFKELVRNAVN
jgi:hypothetical protein